MFQASGLLISVRRKRDQRHRLNDDDLTATAKTLPIRVLKNVLILSKRAYTTLLKLLQVVTE